MSLNQTYTKSAPKVDIPEGVQLGKLYSIVDLGVHVNERFKDKNGNPIAANKVMLTFELQDVLLPDGRPAATNAELTASLSDKATIQPILIGLLGGGADAISFVRTEGREVSEVLSKVLGKPLQLNMVKNEKGYVNIKGTMPVTKSTNITPTVNELILVTDVNNVSPDTLAKIPEFVKKKMANRVNKEAGSAIGNDTDCPF